MRARFVPERLACIVAIASLALAISACSGEQEATGPAPGEASERMNSGSRPAGRLTRDRREVPHRVTMTFSGDILVHEPVWERALGFGGGSRYAFEPMFAPIRDAIESADLSVCHLETPLVRGAPQGYPLFATPPELAKALASTGWDACSTASNHSLDQGIDGIASTNRALARAGIAHAGTSARPGSRSGPALIRAGGERIALLSYTTDTNGLAIAEPSSVDLAEPGRIRADARRARAAGADAVVVNIHWGSAVVPEYVSRPNGAQRELIARLLDSGAITAVVGQGPHVVQPIELRRGGAVVLSSGNLISNQGAGSGLAAASQDGVVVRLRIEFPAQGRARVGSARWLPILTTRPDYVVAPVSGRSAGRPADLDAATAAASFARTADAVGRSPRVRALGRPPGG